MEGKVDLWIGLADAPERDGCLDIGTALGWNLCMLLTHREAEIYRQKQLGTRYIQDVRYDGSCKDEEGIT